MYDVSDLRKGQKIEIDGVPWVVTEFTFSKPGKGQAIYNCKLKNLLNGSTMSKTFRSADKIDKPELSEKTLQFSYAEGDHYIFLDENYEQVTISAEILGDSRFFLCADTQVDVLFYKQQAIEVTLPNFVEKTIIETDPGFKGNTATNTLKPAKIEGGYQIQVPLFVNPGDLIKLDTRTGTYADRVSKK